MLLMIRWGEFWPARLGYESASAEEFILPLIGVRGVTNRIRLKQRVTPA